MPADAVNSEALTKTEAGVVAKEAPTAQQESQPGVPKKITNAQTVCNEKNAKGKLCNGHLKQLQTGGEESEKHLSGNDVRFKCQTCGTIYTGPPLGHVRDPEKQSRFVEKELMAILRDAGGTLPVFKKSERGTLVPAEEPASHHAPAAAAAADTKPTAAADKKPAPGAPAVAAKPQPTGLAPVLPAASDSPLAPKVGPPAALKPARPAASPSGTDSSAAADRHRPAAEAQAATGQASAAPMSPAAATASPAAGAETVSDLAPEASTELTPGAPPDERPKRESTAADATDSGTQDVQPEK